MSRKLLCAGCGTWRPQGDRHFCAVTPEYAVVGGKRAALARCFYCREPAGRHALVLFNVGWCHWSCVLKASAAAA